MVRVSNGILVFAFLAFSAFLYSIAPKRAIVPITESPPLGIIESVSGLQRGNTFNFAAGIADFRGSRWTPEGITVKEHAGTAPDQTDAAFRLTERTGNGFHRILTRITGINAGSSYALSLFVKPDRRAGIQFEMSDAATGSYGVALFDFARKAVAAEKGDVSDAGIQSLPNGWYRCWAAMPYATAAATFNFDLLDQNGGRIYAGDGRSGLLIWGVQFESGTRASGYSGAIDRK
jgi:hypothetical protein